jgi:hypothetical protein
LAEIKHQEESKLQKAWKDRQLTSRYTREVGRSKKLISM